MLVLTWWSDGLLPASRDVNTKEERAELVS